MASASTAGHDGVAPDNTLWQIKARRLTKPKGSVQSSYIGGWGFDRLLGIVFAPDYSVLYALELSVKQVQTLQRKGKYGPTIHLKRDLITNGPAFDRTAELRAEQ